MAVFKMDFSKLLSSECMTWISWDNTDGDMLIWMLPQACVETGRAVPFCIKDF